MEGIFIYVCSYRNRYVVNMIITHTAYITVLPGESGVMFRSQIHKGPRLNISRVY